MGLLEASCWQVAQSMAGLQKLKHRHDDGGHQLRWPDLQLQDHSYPLISHCLSWSSPDEAHGAVDPPVSSSWVLISQKPGND